ncbi:Uma2 family endonuclease [Streptomyces sp. NPDC059168]|uniref:Uma2 family endonuclease n=1 Tax=Streptomyces sp. NPDC059168 TaxID=3346753 RepID=UPI0036CA6154
MRCDGVAMFLEVTSTRPGTDRGARRRRPARAGIPLYLLVDREASSLTLFGEPGSDDYRRHGTLPFGRPPALPESFALDLETSELL